MIDYKKTSPLMGTRFKLVPFRSFFCFGICNNKAGMNGRRHPENQEQQKINKRLKWPAND